MKNSRQFTVMARLKGSLRTLPLIGPLSVRVIRGFRRVLGLGEKFTRSDKYWEERYQKGGNSGPGSYGHLAQFKAEFLNNLVKREGVRTVIEFGCGDGNQLSLATYPNYLGLDVSRTAIELCRGKFLQDSNKRFAEMSEYRGETAEVTLSLDVIYHLVEDDVFERYMVALFSAAQRFVVIYASDNDENADYVGTHVRQRKFTPWVAKRFPGWKLVSVQRNAYPYQGDETSGSFADFFVYSKVP